MRLGNLANGLGKSLGNGDMMIRSGKVSRVKSSSR